MRKLMFVDFNSSIEYGLSIRPRLYKMWGLPSMKLLRVYKVFDIQIGTVILSVHFRTFKTGGKCEF